MYKRQRIGVAAQIDKHDEGGDDEGHEQHGAHQDVYKRQTLPYGTVHRLASAGKHKGVGKAVLDWSMEHCQSLRADTHADNKIKMCIRDRRVTANTEIPETAAASGFPPTA